jgi:hypothetical protein
MVNNKHELVMILKFVVISLGLTAVSSISWAANTAAVNTATTVSSLGQQPVVQQQAKPAAPVPAPKVIIQSKVIDNVDKDASNMNALKRQLELEKIRADILKVKTGADKPVNAGDTTVTSVYIDQNDPLHGKYATLQFVDGTNVDVEIGAKVGSYTVSDITMVGVTLAMPHCRSKDSSCKRTIEIGRLYAKNKDKDKDKDADKDKPVVATPVVNLHNENSVDLLNDKNGSKDQMVPPIITKN